MAEFIRVDVQKLKEAERKIKNLKAVLSSSDAVVVDAAGGYFRKMQRLASYAYQDTKDYIKNQASTPTGLARGNPKGRYDTGDMYRAFRSTPGGGRMNTKAGGKGVKMKFYYEMGWLDRAPFYTIFQEYGTANGIKAMNALGYAKISLDDFVVREHAHSIPEMRRQIREGFFMGLRKGVRVRSTKLPPSFWRGVAADEE